MMSMRQTGRRDNSTGTKSQSGAAPSPIRRVLAWSVFTVSLLCVSFLFSLGPSVSLTLL
jgi:hypothetical protein